MRSHPLAGQTGLLRPHRQGASLRPHQGCEGAPMPLGMPSGGLIGASSGNGARGEKSPPRAGGTPRRAPSGAQPLVQLPPGEPPCSRSSSRPTLRTRRPGEARLRRRRASTVICLLTKKKRVRVDCYLCDCCIEMFLYSMCIGKEACRLVGQHSRWRNPPWWIAPICCPCPHGRRNDWTWTLTSCG